MLSKTAVVVFALLSLAACAEQPSRPARMVAVQIAPEMTLVMPAPSRLDRRLEAVQLISARHGDSTLIFEAHVSLEPGRVGLIALDQFGRRAISASWTDVGLSAEVAPWVPKEIRVDNMLADIVILFWPEADVRTAIANSGGVLKCGPGFRTISRAGKETIHADYDDDTPWNGSLHYRNLAWDYALDIRSAETAP